MTCIQHNSFDPALQSVAVDALDALGPLADPRDLERAAAALPRRHPDRRVVAGILDGLKLHFWRGSWSDPHYRQGWDFGRSFRRHRP